MIRTENERLRKDVDNLQAQVRAMTGDTGESNPDGSVGQGSQLGQYNKEFSDLKDKLGMEQVAL